jgi:hypothetical protein
MAGDVEENPVDGLRREEVEVEGGPVLLATHTSYGPEGISVLAIGFRGRIVGGGPRPADDVAEVRWISAAEVDGTDFASEHDREFVRAALEG